MKITYTKVVNEEVMDATPMTLGEFSLLHGYPISETADPHYKGYRLAHRTVMFPACYVTWVSEYDFNLRFKKVEE
jgi:hypothetical protein